MNKYIEILGALLRELCFERGCVLCDRPLVEQGEYLYGLCLDCQKELTLDFTIDSRCPHCGRPLISEQTSCMTCRQHESPPQDIALALYPYLGKAKKMLESYKFNKNIQLAWFLVNCLDQAVQYLAGIGYHFDAWVPVPSSPGKLKQKGWDHIITLSLYLDKLRKQKLHRATGANPPEQNMPVITCLERLPSESQKKLHRTERTINLNGKIRCIDVVPKRVLLFDDVMTTGSTLRVCAKALKEGGAELVGTVVLFYD
ncbi:ComF family protein [Gracilinema caldarium]|nr:phosphoribosyltransferase family protein [Gracilinema caldarium]